MRQAFVNGLIIIALLVLALPLLAQPDTLSALQPQLASPYAEEKGVITRLVRIGLPATPKLLEAMRSPNATMRANAVLAMAQIRDARAFPVLAKLLTSDTSDVVRLNSAAALAKYEDDKAISVLTTAVGDRNATVRAGAADALAYLRAESAVPTLRRLLADPVPLVRARAAIALGLLRDAGSITQLRPLLLDAAPAVRAATASTLGKVQDTESVPRIIELVEDRAPVNAQDGNENTVALAAIEGLGYLRDPRAVAPIMAVMHVPNQEYSRPYVALAALARIGDPRAVRAILPFAGEEWHEGAGTNFRKYGGESAMRQLGESAEPELRAAFTDPDVAYRAAAVRYVRDYKHDWVGVAFFATLHDENLQIRGLIDDLLARVRAPRPLEQAGDAMQDADPAIRRRVLRYLTASTDPQAVPLILPEVSATDQAQRAAAVTALAGKLTPAAVTALLVALRDTSAGVRAAAAGALAGVTDAAAVPALVFALHDTEIPVRRQSATTLGTLPREIIGDALPPLQSALNDPDLGVQQAAVTALRQLRDPRAIPGLIALIKAAAQHPPKVDEQTITNAAFNSSPPPPPWLAAIFALGEMQHPDADTAVRNLLFASPALTAAIANSEPEYLYRLGAGAVPLVIAGLHHPDVKVRRYAAWQASDIARETKDSRLAIPLISALADTADEVRDAAAEGLSYYKSIEVRSALLEAANTHPSRKIAAVLGQYSGADIHAVLAMLLRNPSYQVRLGVLEALTNIQDAQFITPVLPIVQKGTIEQRRAAIFALRHYRDARVITALSTALRDTDKEIRLAVLSVLAWEKGLDRRMTPALIAALHDSHYQVRADAARVLGMLQDPRALDPLKAALQGQDGLLRGAAVEALSNFYNLRLIPPLITALQSRDLANRNDLTQRDEYRDVRGGAAFVLSQYTDPRVEPALIAALQIHDSEVRHQATAALIRRKSMSAIPDLLRFFYTDDGAPDYYVLTALKALSGQDLGEDVLVWREWWSKQTK
ncbi:MAG: HEAT repeat domain-containing protein [Armatimonadota bacterium]